jgi:hypothetical protein
MFDKSRTGFVGRRAPVTMKPWARVLFMRAKEFAIGVADSAQLQIPVPTATGNPSQRQHHQILRPSHVVVRW